MARGLGGTALAGGGTRDGARDAAETLVRQGATALLSFGYAGGLDPALRPGDLLVPNRVLAEGRRYDVDPQLAASFGGMGEQAMLGAAAVLATVAAKQRARADTGAAAVDLESGAVAAIAARNHLPFAVLRAICDPADRALPPIAVTALDRQGRVRVAAMLAAILRHPGQVPALRALGQDAAAARAALRARVELTGRLG